MPLQNADSETSETLDNSPSKRIIQQKILMSKENLKKQQNAIIQKSNPMLDDYHTGIRGIEDIYTFAETLKNGDFEEGGDFDPDYTWSMAQTALNSGKITVYSSYPIKQGVFVFPSKMEAESYSGKGKILGEECVVSVAIKSYPYVKNESPKFYIHNAMIIENKASSLKQTGSLESDNPVSELTSNRSIPYSYQNSNPSAQNNSDSGKGKDITDPKSKDDTILDDEDDERLLFTDVGDLSFENAAPTLGNSIDVQRLLKKHGGKSAERMPAGNGADEDMCAAKLGMQTFLVTDCLINRSEKDITRFCHGSFEDFCQKLCAEE